MARALCVCAQEGVAISKEPAVSARVRREQLKGKVDILREFVDESLEAKVGEA